jgi:hypothetical protein
MYTYYIRLYIRFRPTDFMSFLRIVKVYTLIRRTGFDKALFVKLLDPKVLEYDDDDDDDYDGDDDDDHDNDDDNSDVSLPGPSRGASRGLLNNDKNDNCNDNDDNNNNKRCVPTRPFLWSFPRRRFRTLLS